MFLFYQRYWPPEGFSNDRPRSKYRKLTLKITLPKNIQLSANEESRSKMVCIILSAGRGSKIFEF